MPLLFTFSEYSETSKSLCGLPGLKTGQFTILRYDNQELHASVESSVAGDHCFILGSITPPECQMVSFLLLAHTLKKEGAMRVTGILPYLAYSRDDKQKPGHSLATAWTGTVLKASGFDEIWTVDLHSEQDKTLFPLPVQSLLPSAIFRESLGRLALNGASFAFPDQGAILRCQPMMSAAALKSQNLVYFEKHRTEGGIVHQEPVGKVERRVVIVDDILDTGATLVSACEKLVAAGAEELYICVTHGLFTGQQWHGLWSLPVKRIFCTDTIPACAHIRDSRITVLPVAPVLREELLRAGCNAEAAS
jgi:ribose-phosphate pyrophosphokinase